MYRITIQADSKRAFVPSAVKLKHWAKAALRHKLRKGELTMRLVGKKEIQTLNKTYRHKDKPTNVLSFPADLPAEVKLKVPLLGDLVICSEIVNQEADSQGKTPEAHWAHIVIHGCLHLLGYDHETEAEAEVMEGKEIRLLKSLGFNDPYQV
jgi:probable rRNA maturation factor